MGLVVMQEVGPVPPAETSRLRRSIRPVKPALRAWVRAEQRTKNTARLYNELGLPEYYALEGFVRFSGQL